MISNMPRSIAFYRDVLGMKLTMMVGADQQIISDGEKAVFAALDWDGSQLMLQTIDSLSAELPEFDSNSKPTPSGTIYFRNLHPQSIAGRVSKDQIIKGPVLQWYGMMELYIHDPDGYIICVGAPQGAPPD